MFIIPFYTSLNQLLLLYTLELITLIYLLNKYSKSAFQTLIILLFYTAIFAFLGKNIQNGYRIVMIFTTLWLCYKRKVFSHLKKGDSIITLLFVLFSISFGISSVNNNDTITIILSQYSRYLIAYCMWFLVRNEIYEPKYDNQILKNLTYDIVIMQIVISVGKFIIYGGKQLEGLVGSIAHTGGSDGTALPILCFIVLWFYNQGKFTNKDWLIVVGLMLVGFLAGKRAVWFIMPIVMAGFMIYVPKLRLNKALWATIIMAPLAFYFGVRLTPNMNPENQVWGSFDYEYALDFADKYQFGDKTKPLDGKVEGRGGATIALWTKFTADESLTESDWLGIGLGSMYASDYDDFDKLNTGIGMKGDATGVFQSFLTIGYVGIITTILFFFSMLWRIKMTRIRWVIIGIVAWEYFMYIGNIFRTPAYMFLIVYFIHYSNFLIQKRTKVQPFSDFIPRV